MSDKISVTGYADLVGKNVLPVSLDKVSNWDSTITCNVRAATYLPMQVKEVIPLVQDKTINGVFSFTPFWVDNNIRQFYLEFVPSRGSIMVSRFDNDSINESLSCADQPFNLNDVETSWSKSVPYSNVDSILLVILRAGGASLDK